MLKFDIKQGKLIVRAQDLTVPILKEIYERDTTKLKTRALQDLLYIYHMADTDSPYADMDETVKEAHVRRAIFGTDKKIRIDTKITDAIEEYMECNINTIDRVLFDFNKKIDDLRQQITDAKISDSNIDKVIERMQKFDKLLEAKEKIEIRQQKKAVITVRGQMKTSYQEKKGMKNA